jgi:F-type H+-transporting ATPase subunit b
VHLVTVTVSEVDGLQVILPAQTPTTEATETTEVADTGPSPIAPEKKELLWGAGSFIVLAILVRLFLFPRLKTGMDARHELVRRQLEEAEALRSAAEGELAEYNAELAKVRAEANARIDAARQTLEAERQARLAQVNAEIAERRAAAAAEADAAKAAAREQVLTAGAQVARLAAQRVLGRPADPTAARAAVESAVAAEVH